MIYKPHPCAFTDTPLDAHLKQLGKNKIVLVGEFVLFSSRAIHSIPLRSREREKNTDLIDLGYMVSPTLLTCFPLFPNL